MNNKIIEKLIDYSFNSLKYSYSPYSKFKVGCSLLTMNGKIYSGSNVECASYSLTICAERATAVKAISEGNKKFKIICITSNKNQFAFPCGACLQFLTEFSEELIIILAKSKKEYLILNLNELLPNKFILKK